jgi:hypothetical protein
MPTGPLTIYNTLSVADIIYDKAGNSNNWNNTHTSVTSNSANWQSTYATVSTLSSTWDLGYTGYNGLTALSANWQSTYTTMTANSANWNLGYEGYTVLNSNSANWNSAYSTVQSNSSITWNYQGEDLKALSGEWVGGNIAYTNLVANSAAYLSGVDLSFLSVSANWQNTYATVSTLSAGWEESAGTIPTVINYLSTNNVLISSATITSGLQVNNDVLIYGNLSATGTSTFANTIFTTTTAISVVNVGSGTAMWVGNNGVGDIASFYDIDQDVEVLHIGGENSLVSSGVGVRTSYPNKALTVNGEISANNIIYDASGNSANWNLGYEGYTVLNSNSGNWNDTYSTVQSNSGGWVGGNIAYTNLIANSANWNLGYEGYTVLNSNSGNWNDTYSTVQSNSGGWVGGNIAYTNLIANSANWQNTYTFVSTTSSLYVVAGGNTRNANLTIGTNDAYHLRFETNNIAKMSILSSGEVGIGTTLSETLNAGLNGAGLYVKGNSITSGILSSTSLITNSVSASESIIPVTVTNISIDKTFTNADTNKIFHFDTTSAPLTASFPGTLTDGFNAAIMNTGTNYLYISSNIQYNAVGNKLIDRYSGAYVYKSNSNIFAVGGV